MAPALICSSNSSATPLDLEVFPFPKGIKQCNKLSNTCGIQLIYSQTRSSVPGANELMNSFTEK